MSDTTLRLGVTPGKFNYIHGDSMQIDFDQLELIVQRAYVDKKNELSDVLRETDVFDRYDTARYHQHTRGAKVERLASQFATLADMVHQLQAFKMSKERRDNFTMYYHPDWARAHEEQGDEHNE